MTRSLAPSGAAAETVDLDADLAWNDHAGRAKAICSAFGVFNYPSKHYPGMRDVGFRVPEKIAGLSEALFAGGEIKRRVKVYDDLFAALKFAEASMAAVLAHRVQGASRGDVRDNDASRKALANLADALAAARAALSAVAAATDGGRE